MNTGPSVQVFGQGAIAQHVLSQGTMSSGPAVTLTWGVGVSMGIYSSGGVSGRERNVDHFSDLANAE